MHRDVHAADEMLGGNSATCSGSTLDRVGTQQVPLTDEVRFAQEVSRDRTDAIRRSPPSSTVDIDPEVLDAPVPNLVLQPLVENSLRHGIGPRVGVGKVDVTASHANAELLHVGSARQRRRVVARQVECVLIRASDCRTLDPRLEIPLRRSPSDSSSRHLPVR